jgi:8-oxo-dGTP pyrophosphatase MutT (NUDIX family)
MTVPPTTPGPTYHCCGFLFHRETGSVLLHHRDAGTADLPGVWSFFCGKPEPEDGGDPAATWRREMREELGVAVEPGKVVPFGVYVDQARGAVRHVFYVEWTDREHGFVLSEGDGIGWFTIEEALALPDLPELAKGDLRRFAAKGYGS